MLHDFEGGGLGREKGNEGEIRNADMLEEETFELSLEVRSEISRYGDGRW